MTKTNTEKTTKTPHHAQPQQASAQMHKTPPATSRPILAPEHMPRPRATTPLPAKEEAPEKMEAPKPAPTRTVIHANAPQSLIEDFEAHYKLDQSALNDTQKIRALAHQQTTKDKRTARAQTKAKPQNTVPQKHTTRKRKQNGFEQSSKIDMNTLTTPKKTASPRATTATHTSGVTNAIDPAQFSKTHGFGADVPLAFALGQIVPKDHSYAFDKGINLGQKVSWNGGHAWPLTIQNMITPLGLNVTMRGTKAIISRKGQALRAQSITGTAKKSEATFIGAKEKQTIYPAHLTQGRSRASSRNRVTMIQSLHPEVAAQTDHKPARHDDGIQEPVKITKRPKMVQPLPDPIFEQRKRAVHQPESLTHRSIQFWQAHKGESLRDILIRWAPDANVELAWNATEDYRVNDNLLINDSFSNAIIALFTKHMTLSRAPEIAFVDTKKDGMATRLIVKDRKS